MWIADFGAHRPEALAYFAKWRELSASPAYVASTLSIAVAVTVGVTIRVGRTVPVVTRGVAVAVPIVRIAEATVRRTRSGSGSGAECETSDYASCNSTAAPAAIAPP